MLVRDVMRKTVSVRAEETLEVAALRLKQENVGALPVVEADRVAGMITDRDILLRGAAGGRSGRSMERTKAREVMSVGAVACHDTDDLDHALGLMSRNRIHRLPVLDGNEKLVGVLSLNQFRTPSSEPAAFEVVFYKQLPNSTGHVHNVELTRVAVARGSSKAEAVQAAIKEFEQEKASRWDLVADGYDVLEWGSNPPQTERIRQRAHELWEQEGRPEGRQDEHWARACREIQMEEKSGTDNTANRAKAGIDDAGSNVKDVANTFGQKADEAVQYASQTYHSAKDVAQQQIGDLERQIRGKPVQSALIAFGVGFVVGTLLTR